MLTVQAAQIILEVGNGKIAAALSNSQGPESTIPISSASNSATTGISKEDLHPALRIHKEHPESSHEGESASRESTAVELLNLRTALTSLSGMSDLCQLEFELHWS